MIIVKIFIWLPGNLYMKSGIHPPQKAGAARRAASETADHNTSTTKKKKLIWMWLVVSTPLKNINQLDWSIQIDGTIKNVPSHQPDSDVGLLFHLFSISMMWNLHGKWMRSVLWIFLGNLLIGTKWRTRDPWYFSGESNLLARFLFFASCFLKRAFPMSFLLGDGTWTHEDSFRFWICLLCNL